MRVTNNSTLDEGLIKQVFRTESGGYRVIMKDGVARTYRRVQITEEARQKFDEIAATSTWDPIGG